MRGRLTASNYSAESSATGSPSSCRTPTNRSCHDVALSLRTPLNTTLPLRLKIIFRVFLPVFFTDFFTPILFYLKRHPWFDVREYQALLSYEKLRDFAT
jgi:hypothetical protein